MRRENALTRPQGIHDLFLPGASMSRKSMVMLGMVVGSIVGGYVGGLIGGGDFSAASILCSLAGGLAGIWIGYKIG